jgi:hypothetical protein
LCFYPSKGSGVGNSYFLDYHNNMFFGLAKNDCNLVIRKHHPMAPNCAKRDKHALYMTELIVNMA